jgi:hypothetical protein
MSHRNLRGLAAPVRLAVTWQLFRSLVQSDVDFLVVDIGPVLDERARWVLSFGISTFSGSSGSVLPLPLLLMRNSNLAWAVNTAALFAAAIPGGCLATSSRSGYETNRGRPGWISEPGMILASSPSLREPGMIVWQCKLQMSGGGQPCSGSI